MNLLLARTRWTGVESERQKQGLRERNRWWDTKKTVTDMKKQKEAENTTEKN